MRGKTACENCGSSSDFLKDSAGFYVCLECGQQQQDYREEYRWVKRKTIARDMTRWYSCGVLIIRDEFDVLFETTGQHVNDLGDVRNLSRSQKSVAAFTEVALRRISDSDYFILFLLGRWASAKSMQFR